MLKSIELKGYFSLPENPTEELPGILKFSKEEGIELDLFGHFSHYNGPGSRDRNIVLGFTSDGKKITLLNCYEISKGMNVPGFPQSKISAIYMLIGQHYQSPKEIAFDSCSLQYADFNNWLDISGFEKPVYDEGAKEFTIKYKQPDKITFSLKKDWDAEIEFTFYTPHTYFTPVSKAGIEQHPLFTIKPKQTSSFDDFQNSLSVFNSFLALNYFSFPLIESIVFYEPKIKEDEYDLDFTKVDLYFKLGMESEKYKEHSSKHAFFLQYKDFKQQFPETIQNWYSLYDKVEASVKILTECFMGRGNPMEFHFIGLAQALENMHRRVSGKDVNLYTRLTEIIDNLPFKVKAALLGNETDFARRVTQNRNFYTHYSEKHEASAASLPELFVLSEKLKIILISYFLRQLKIGDNEIEAIIINKGVFLFNHLIKLKG